MQKLFYIFFLFSFFCSSQNKIKAHLKDSTKLNVDAIFGVDNFGTIYYTDNSNSFYKKDANTTISYANFQLGKITDANTFNPLKINLFYRDFNTVVILDNRLAEISKIDFNIIQPYKNISYVSTGFDNTLWLFNQNTQQLELYDYKIHKTRFKTVPIQAQILDLKSDYNYCFMLTETYIYIYNYFGSLMSKYKNEGYTSMAFSKAHLVFKKENKLFLRQKNKAEILAIEHPKMLINQFLVTNESLYIYNDGILHQYQLKVK